MKRTVCFMLLIAMLLSALLSVSFYASGRGDLNDDGSVDNKDVVILFKYVSKEKIAYDEAYDINGDGEVDNKDVVALFTYVSTFKDRHFWSVWKTISDPSCTEEGIKQRRCLECGKTEEATVAALGHNFINGQCVRCGEYENTASTDLFNFTLLDDNTYMIEAKSKRNLPSDLILPQKYNGRKITTIKFNGFTEAPIQNLIIPEGYTTIQSLAFFYCKKLKSVTFPKSMKLINSQAFSSCSSLSSATFLNTVNWKIGTLYGGYFTVKVTISSDEFSNKEWIASCLKDKYETREWICTTGSGYNW